LDSNEPFNYTGGDKVAVEILGGEECDVKRQLDITDISENTTTQKDAPDLILSCDPKQDVPLSAGWNGIPAAFLRTGDANVSSVLSEADEQDAAIQEIASWNAEQGSWKSKVVGRPFNNFSILPCQGYFVRASEPSLLQIPPSTGIHTCDVVLQQSWNFISLPATDWSIHICGQPFGDFEMEPQMPYFIKSNRASDWNPQKSAVAATYDDHSVNTGLLATSSPTITDIDYANVNDGSITIIWRTDKPATGQIYLYNQTDDLINSVDDDRGEAYVGTVHQVTLTGLRPETAYQLAIHAGETVDDNIPSVQTAYGQVQDSAGNPIAGAQVYATISGGAPLSAITNEQGYWSLNLGALRTVDGTDYLDRTDETLAIEVITPAGITGRQSLATENLTPAPTLVLEGYRIYLPVITR